MPQPRIHFLQRFLRWRYLFIVNFAIVLFLGLTLGREFIQTRAIQNEIQSLQVQAESLSARNFALTELQTAVQTESFIEREARLKLGLKKPGEEVVIIQDHDPGASTPSDQESSDPFNLVLEVGVPKEQVANATKWWYYFFDKSSFDAYASR